MSFNVPSTAYGQFMGRFSEPLAEEFVATAEVRPGQRALDVGCGPGALTERLAQLLGASSVSAIDPSAPFLAAVTERVPGVDARLGTAEDLPFGDATFDAALAELSVHFMTDPVSGLQEMARVTRAGGVVAACVWNHAQHPGPLSLFWDIVRELDPRDEGEDRYAGVTERDLGTLFEDAGFEDVDLSLLTVEVGFASFEEWWETYLLGVGPPGEYVRGLDDAALARLQAACRAAVPAGRFDVTVVSRCAVARVR